MLWDIFCRVIDNFGDIGVCWRLTSDLAERGHRVRLWVDDASALAWMAPQVAWDPGARGIRGATLDGIEVRPWTEAESALPDVQPGEVVIEAFGCELPAAFVERMVRPQPPAWINLEYLSAEAYVERSHRLPSPVWSGPGTGLTKWFFYPGFTPATGGLLVEPGLMEAQDTFTPEVARRWLADQGINTAPGDRLVSVFCYGGAPLPSLLDRLQEGSHERPATHVLLTPGFAARLAEDWTPAPDTRLTLHQLPALPQRDFDRLLWACDLNLVRGEDSAVRALWAGKPHVWQIYPQDDGVHADKLQAFMDRWMQDWPTPLRQEVAAWWRAWNGLSDTGGVLPSLPAWSEDAPWAVHSRASRQKTLLQRDLCSQLVDFAQEIVTRSE